LPEFALSEENQQFLTKRGEPASPLLFNFCSQFAAFPHASHYIGVTSAIFRLAIRNDIGRRSKPGRDANSIFLQVTGFEFESMISGLPAFGSEIPSAPK
jgi:hypothetical protein